MKLPHKKKILTSVLALACINVPNVYAATTISLNHQNILALQTQTLSPALEFKERQRNLDFNQTLHVRLDQQFSGIPIFGGEVIVHIPQGNGTDHSLAGLMKKAEANRGFLTGIYYQNLMEDLGKTPPNTFSQRDADKAIAEAIANYKSKANGGVKIENISHQLMIHIDEKQKAHYVYQIKFYVRPSTTSITPAMPVYLIDARTLEIYRQWDDIQTEKHVVDFGGGYGGNKKTGRSIYDGLFYHLPKLMIERDPVLKKCYWQTTDVKVEDLLQGEVMTFDCKTPNKIHNNVYWMGEQDKVNDGYSPADDALFGGTVIKDMYQNWYQVPVLVEDDGKPMLLHMIIHIPNYDNAYWHPVEKKMFFGDGYTYLYPLTSLGVAAHEISHGFTQQHSNLVYGLQSGGMNEAFSDMAAQAAEFYAYGRSSWQIGPEILKAKNEAIRYMDQPSKDCKGGKPGSLCSIDDASQYKDDLDVHYSSGVYNRLFYLIATSKGWDTKKAFDIMVQANVNYWTKKATFSTGACGLLEATKDHGYDLETVKNALNVVKIDISECEQKMV